MKSGSLSPEFNHVRTHRWGSSALAGSVEVLSAPGFVAASLAFLAILCLCLFRLRRIDEEAMLMIAAAALGAGLAVWAGAAAAAPMTFNYSFTAEQIGPGFAPFGISSVPAGPFTATVTFDLPLRPHEELFRAPTLSGSATAGDDTFSDPIIADLDTDDAGQITYLLAAFEGPDATLALALGFDASHQPFTEWVARDVSLGPVCSFATAPFTLISGPCVGGDASTLSFTEIDANAVPEPATLPLLGSMLAFLVVARRAATG